MRNIITIIIVGCFTGCVSVQHSDLESEILKLTREHLPSPGTRIEDVAKLWPEREHGSYPPWTGKGREGASHAITWPKGDGGRTTIRISLRVNYQDSRVVSSYLHFPDLYSDSISVNKDNIIMPTEPSKEQILRDTLEMLKRLKKEQKKIITQNKGPAVR